MSRFGLYTIRRRGINAGSVKPIGRYQHRFENFHLYGTVAPECGNGSFLDLPKLDQARRRACALLQVARSTLNYRSTMPAQDQELAELLRVRAQQHPHYDYRRVLPLG